MRRQAIGEVASSEGAQGPQNDLTKRLGGIAQNIGLELVYYHKQLML